MSLIEKFVEIRLDNFIQQFDINIDNFSIHSFLDIRKNSWEILKRKLINHRYGSNEYDLIDCRLVIKNIIWKNIMFFEIIGELEHVRMYHIKYRDVKDVNRTSSPYLTYHFLLNKFLLNKTTNYIYAQKNNCCILQAKIINYIMLVDILITENMIEDLIPMFKAYIFDVILVL